MKNKETSKKSYTGMSIIVLLLGIITLLFAINPYADQFPLPFFTGVPALVLGLFGLRSEDGRLMLRVGMGMNALGLILFFVAIL